MIDISQQYQTGNSAPIGVFDSGLGGISVLRALQGTLPCEDFIYFGDSANAPYGEKNTGQVRALSFSIVEALLGMGVKAIVIACNTATSAAAQSLRSAFPEIPIIGVEPALKPAASDPSCSRILVMATPMTLEQEKFCRLLSQYQETKAIIPLPCPGLAGRIEQGNLDAPDLRQLLLSLLGDYAGTVDGVVLGCTHYPFIRPQIAEILGHDVRFFDGSAGTARELRRRLTTLGLRTASVLPGSVQFLSSRDTPEEKELYLKFYTQEI